jgi:uncharacterized protein YjeT (DUF2065 family)
MRSIGLLLLLIGAVTLTVPIIRSSLPTIAFDDSQLRIAGASVLMLGLLIIWFTRTEE